MRGATDIDKVVGQRIRQLRMQSGMSQDALAQKLGLSFQQIQKYEKGVNRCATDRLIIIAKALGTTVPDIIGLGQNIATPETPFDSELYKLAMAFQKLPVGLRAPIRSLINKLIEEDG